MELEFPWEMRVSKITQIYNHGNPYIKFIHNGTVKYSSRDLVEVRESSIKILEIKLYPSVSSFNDLGINIEAYRTSPIPHIPELKSVYQLFKNSKFKTIPDDLFKYNPNIIYAKECFYNCQNLTTIPNTLFENNSTIIDFFSTFSHCESLTTIPYNLFSMLDPKNQIAFMQCFANCTGIKELPQGLFSNIDNIEKMKYMFSNCHNLEKINGDIFSNNAKIDSEYFNLIFYYCNKLNNIPKELLLRLI